MRFIIITEKVRIMKKIHLLVFVFMSTFGFISAQNYQAVFPDRAMFFNYYGIYASVNFDSTSNNNSQLFPFKIVRKIDVNCYSPSEPSLFGKEVLIQGNGYYNFLNYNFDTIKIKTDAVLNENWLFFRDSNYLVTANISNISVENVMGNLDSVKTISIQFADTNGNPINIFQNVITLKISKNYGLFHAIDFALFPYTIDVNPIILIGLSNPNVGFSKFHWFESFNLHSGDELHISESENNSLPPQAFQMEKKMILKYLSRVDHVDSITYTVDREMSYSYNYPYSYTYTHDTIQEVIHRNDIFDQNFPGKPIITNSEVYLYRYNQNMITIPTISSFSYGEPPCYNETIFDGCDIENEYYKGLGGPYYRCSYSFQDANRDLVYYKKDGVSHGNPISLVGIDQYETIKNPFSISPNPAVDQVTITFKNEGSFALEFYDLLGKLVQTETITNSGQVINISSLKSGMYLYRIKDGIKTIQIGKLIRE